MGYPLIGGWRIGAADIWDRDCPELRRPAVLDIRAEGDRESPLRVSQTILDIAYGHSDIFFEKSGVRKIEEVGVSD